MTERQLGVPPRAPRVGGMNYVAVIMPSHPYLGFVTEATA